MQFQGRIQSFRPMPKPVAKATPLPAQISFREIKDDGDAPF